MSYTSAIGFTPLYKISKDGEDITGNFNDRSIRIKVELNEGGGASDVIDIDLDDRDWMIASPSIGEGSATLQLYLGYAENALYDMGTYEIDELTYRWMPKTMSLHGNSLGFNTAAKAPVITSYDGKTLGDIVGSIAQSAGVSPAVDPSLAGITIPYLNQHASMMHLLQDLERRYNGLAKFQDGILSFTQRGTGNSVSGTSIGGFVLGQSDFGSGDIKLTSRNAYSKVRAAYWDKINNQLTWLQSQIGGNPNSTIPYMIKRGYNSQDEAQHAADSTMAELNRKCKTGQIMLAKGDPSIRAGGKMAIAGCRDGVDGTYTIQTAIHTYDKESGIMTTLEIYDEGDGISLPPSITDESQVSFDGIPIST